MDYFGQLFAGNEPRSVRTTRRAQPKPTTPPAMVNGDALEAAQQAANQLQGATLAESLGRADGNFPHCEPLIIDIDYEEIP